MLRSIHSPSDAHEDHLRHLLDLRTARADLHSRIPSVSEFTDTPSIYSNAYFSPRPIDTGDIDLDDRMPYTRSHKSATSEAVSSVSEHKLLSDPGASILELDDDPSRSSPRSHGYDGLQEGNEDHEGKHPNKNEDDQPDPRMSLLGPRMRFHSRAPWETGEDALEEDGEPEDGAIHTRGRGVFAMGEGIIKGFGLSSSSRRSSSAGRRSGESGRSQTRSKASVENTLHYPSSPRNALRVNASAPPPCTSPYTLHGSARTHFPSTHSRPYTPSNTSPLPSPHLSPERTHSISHSYSPRSPTTPSSPTPPNFRGASVNGRESSGQRNYYSHSLESHPFANPDFAVPCTPDPTPPSPLQPAIALTNVPRSSSCITVTESTTTSSLSKSLANSAAPTPDRSISSFLHHGRERTTSRVSNLAGKEISSPMAFTRPLAKDNERGSGDSRDGSLTVPNGFPGWNDKLASPTFALISLEEAQARRSRSTALQPVPRPAAPPEPSNVVLNPSVFPPEPEGDPRTGSSVDLRPSGSAQSARQRARSISAGAKAKSALQNIVGSSVSSKGARGDTQRSTEEPQELQAPPIPNLPASGRSPIRKKSGFMRMRIFTGKEKEREKEKHDPPPAPALSESYVYVSTPQSTKLTLHRVPVPELTADTSPTLSKRVPPSLSINTSSQLRSLTPSMSIDSASRSAPIPGQAMHLRSIRDPTYSAPPEVQAFPKLSLRPVSTVFSAHFAEHIVGALSPLGTESSGETATITTAATTPLDEGVPITPVSSMRSLHNLAAPSPKASSDEQSAVIHGLREQIATAKKAWQRHIWELECQVRDLRAQVEDMSSGDGATVDVGGDEDESDFCEKCGRGRRRADFVQESTAGDKGGVVNRPRARTGAGTARFGSAI